MRINKIVRRIIYVILFCLFWEITYRSHAFSELLFPSLSSIGSEFIQELQGGELIAKTIYSLEVIGKGLLIGIVLAIILTSIATISPLFEDLFETIISVMHPLPGLALLPLVMLWFGIGENAIIFIIVHSVLWPMSINILTGYKSMPKIYKEVGQNIGLRGARLVLTTYVPASFASILSGLKVGWARSWRALISAEMVFGASGKSSGLGWYIFEKRYQVDIPGLFSILIIIILIGVFVEDVLFGIITDKTVRKWGILN